MLDAALASAAFSSLFSGTVTISFTPPRLSLTGNPTRVSSIPYAPPDCTQAARTRSDSRTMSITIAAPDSAGAK
jgi:hypothetical protein